VTPPADPRAFSRRLLTWYDRHGRQTLPWKKKQDPYRIWVSEIMLQQTQVATVIPYFERFMTRFPTVQALACARLDAVLHLWTGLGYYARARNLHRAAREIVRVHRGKFPRELEAVQQLPGIGRSTAGAILALAFDQRQPILDGNVKRVLCRYHAIGTPPSERATEEKLWALAERHTPRARVADYTQAIMDLGATVCTRTRPSCGACPVATGCHAHAQQRADDYPVKVRRKPVPVRKTAMLLLRDARRRVLLLRRPAQGLWGGLWSLPEGNARTLRRWCREQLGLAIETGRPWPVVRHGFTHFTLHITPIPADVVGRSVNKLKPGAAWVNLAHPVTRGLAAPVKKLLDNLRTA
jgi:A/G-specific adenine glycosylase